MRDIQIQTIRTLDDNGVMHSECSSGRQCVGLHAIAGRPGRTYVVLKQVDDPAEAAALAALVGPGETVGWAPTDLFRGPL